jgi:hypothetical protein
MNKEIKEVEVVEEEVGSFDKPKSFKSIWKSKTFYVNIIAIIAFGIQHRYGYVIDEATQIQVLSVINILLRTITSEGVSWS